jgi:hypothetical protein
MYTLLRSATFRELALTEMPSFLISFVIANQFYHFGSFGPELIAFLFTWFVIDVVFVQAVKVIRPTK